MNADRLAFVGAIEPFRIRGICRGAIAVGCKTQGTTGVVMSHDKQAMSPPVAWTGSDADRPPSYGELSERLAQADLQMCEMQAHMDELIEANLRLRAEVGEMTLKWLMDKADDHE